MKKILLPVMLVFCLSGALNAAEKEALETIDRANKTNKMLSSDEIGRIRHNYFGLIHWATEIVQVVYPNDERLKQFAEIFYNAKYDPNAMLYDSLPNQKKSELNINLQNAIEKAGELKQYIVTIK